MIKIAIIGAGVSGLIAARDLTFYADVTLFDKSRGLGGRAATRYATPYEFDHGCQFIQGQSTEFNRFLEGLVEQRILKRWDARFAKIDNGEITHQRQWGADQPHYVPRKRMNMLGHHLAEGLDVIREAQITGLNRKNDGWYVTHHMKSEYGPFDWVISAIPSKQATDILPEEFMHLEVISNRKMGGCFSLMLGFDIPLPTEWDAAVVKNANISWVAINSSKPERSDAFSVLINSTNNWADKYLDDDRNWVQEYLLTEAIKVTNLPLHRASHKALHLWRYANIESQAGKPASYIDFDNNLAAIGDWCVKGRIEGAFKSAKDLSKQLLPVLDQKRHNLISA